MGSSNWLYLQQFCQAQICQQGHSKGQGVPFNFHDRNGGVGPSRGRVGDQRAGRSCAASCEEAVGRNSRLFRARTNNSSIGRGQAWARTLTLARPRTKSLEFTSRLIPSDARSQSSSFNTFERNCDRTFAQSYLQKSLTFPSYGLMLDPPGEHGKPKRAIECAMRSLATSAQYLLNCPSSADFAQRDNPCRARPYGRMKRK